jgi:hypothetical protein
MTETTWIDVPVGDVKVGDEVKVDGIGIYDANEIAELTGQCFEEISGLNGPYVWIKDGSKQSRFRRSSITAARRRVEKVEKCGHRPANGAVITVPHLGTHTMGSWGCDLPKEHAGDHSMTQRGTWSPDPKPEPKPGAWKCAMWDPRMPTSYHLGRHVEACRVYRAASSTAEAGWYADTRKGERRKVQKVWEPRFGDPVTMTFKATFGTVLSDVRKAVAEVQGACGWSSLYANAGITLAPIDRRKSDRRKVNRG